MVTFRLRSQYNGVEDQQNWSSALVYYCERKRKIKRGRPGNEAKLLPHV